MSAAGGKCPAIIISGGSGWTTYDGLLLPAYIFASEGITALIYDKRGYGASTGKAPAAFAEHASDILAAVEFLKRRKDIDPEQIVLLGTSNAGWTVPLAASQSKDIAFIVIEVGPAVPPWQQEMMRVEQELRADGFPGEKIQEAVAFMKLKFEVARTGEGWDKLQAVMRRSQEEEWLSYTNPPRSLAGLRRYWEAEFKYDPQPVLEKLTCPTLVLLGELDRAVPVEPNKAIWEAALKKAGNKDYKVVVLPKANHDLLEAETGGRNEYLHLKRLVPAYAETLDDWFTKRLRPAK